MTKIITQILKGGGRTQSYLLAAFFAFAVAQSAKATDYVFTGQVDNNWGTAKNWYTTAGVQQTSVPGNAKHNFNFFTSTYNADSFKNNPIVNIAGNYGNTWKLHVRKFGTESNPVVFRADTDARTITIGNSTADNNTGYYIANDSGDAWLRLEKGKYLTGSAGYWFVGNTGFQGHIVSYSGVEMGCYQFQLKNGSLSLTNTTLNVSNIGYFGCTSGKTPTVYKKDGTWTITGNMHVGGNGNCTFVQDGGKIDAKSYLYVGNPGVGSLTINSGELNVASTFNIGRGGNGNGTVVVNGGTVTGSGNIELGDYGDGNTGTALLEINGGTVNCNGNLQVGCRGIAGSSSVIRIGGAGKLVVKDSSDIYLGNATSGEIYLSNGGELTARTVFFCQRSRGDGVMGTGEDCKLELDGGVAKVKCVKINRADATDGANATVLFNGGTLKVGGDAYASGFIPAHGNLFVKVAENGGMIDTSNYAITIAEDIEEDSSSTGGALTFTGGGKVTFSGAVSCAITQNVGAGTVLGATSTSKAALFSHLTVAIPESGAADGTILVESADSAFAAADLSGITLSGNVNNRYRLVLADSGMKIAIEDTLAGEYVWNDGASGLSWRTTDKWTKNGVAGDWYDSTAAVFETAGDKATVDAAVAAASVTFRADATVEGAATLTVPLVAVSNGVSARIDAPTAAPMGDSFVKDGPGSLTLGSSRTDSTVVADGTLAMTNGATLVGTQLALGTDTAKPVTLDLGGGTLDGNPTGYLANNTDVTIKNGFLTAASGYVNLRDDQGTLPRTWTMENISLTARRLGLNTVTDRESDIAIKNSNLVFTYSDSNYDNWIMQASTNGTMRIDMVDSTVEFGAMVKALGCRDLPSGASPAAPSLYWMMTNSTLRIKNSKSLFFGRDDGNKNIERPTGVLAATNSIIDVTYAIYIGHAASGDNTAGSYTADFESCIITTRQISVYHDRPLNAVRFNNTRFVLPNTGDYWLETKPEFETMGEGGTAIKPVTIDAGGLVMDSNGFDGQLRADPQGPGAITKVGDGTLTVKWNQTSSSALNVDGGMVAVNAGVSIARPISVASGATLKASGAATLSGGVTLAGGATLDVSGTAIVVSDVTVSGTATLKLNGGAFGKGLYSVLSKPGVTAADFDNVTPQLASGAASYDYYVKDNTLYLAVDMTPTGFSWTGEAGDGKMSTAGNWWGGVAPDADDDVDFSSVRSATTIDGDIDATFGTVTMGSGVITFTGDKMAAASFSDTSKIAVGANATVTVEGDLMFAGKTSDFYVLNTIGEGGKFVVTGTFGLESSCTGRPIPQQSRGSGIIVVGGIRDNAETWMFAASNGAPAQKWVVGEQGISGSSTEKGFWMYNNANAAAEFQTYTNDFEYALKTCFRTRAKQFTLNTTGYGDDEGHTITLSAGFYNDGHPLVIAGKGKVVCAATATGTVTDGSSTLNPYSGEVVVTNTATLAINADEVLTTGAITVNSGATLEVAESGTVSLGGSLALANNASLGFNYTNRDTPTLDLNGKTVTFDTGATTNVTVKVSATDRGRARGPQSVLTSGGKFKGVNVALETGHPDWVTDVNVDDNGDIVLTVVPLNTMILVR